jgi:hypothetical protein
MAFFLTLFSPFVMAIKNIDEGGAGTVATKLGIDNIKKALGGLIGLGITTELALKDGKVSWMESAQIGYKAFLAILFDFKNWTAIKAEYADLDESERDEIRAFLKEQFNLEDDYIEAKIISGFKVAIDIEEFFSIKKAA